MSKSDEKKASKKARKTEKVEKPEKAIETEKSSKSKSKKDKSSAKPTKHDSKPSSAFGVVAASKSAFDPTISSLFANSLGPSKPDHPTATALNNESEDEHVDMDDEELSEADSADIETADTEGDVDVEDEEEDAKPAASVVTDDANNRKRKRKDKHDDLEDVYMEKLAREEAKAAAKAKEERSSKRQKKTADGETASDDEEQENSDSEVEDAAEGASADEDDDAATPPPMHESLLPEVDHDLVKSQRTVFLGNVSSEAITSKSAEKTLRNHLSSFFSDLDAPKDKEAAHKIESIRFRSTAFASAIPKKAAFAKKELMEATTKSTNAYVVYSSPILAREAARRLNGTMVLDRHLRVDEVAHPAKVDHKRCIFVGNLGFVDDESNIDKANEEEGIQKRKGKKTPSDVEEGLWRTFGTCGTVESVRVVRDSKTRVGKGFAYVQFTDENAVEAALLHNDKRFPPMLPRKLRVVRAKAIKRNAKPNANTARPPTHTRAKGAGGVYNPKMTSQEASNLGRAGKLFGRAAAAQLRKGDIKGNDGTSIRGPESFVFEGHRASSKQGKQGFKFKGAKNNKPKPGSRASKRTAAWKAGGGKKD